jgi:large conductance mechanosensitive channel
MRNILKEFKAFAIRGNVVDLAVGIVIGAAFGKIVSSLVDNIIMPLAGLLLGGVEFSNLAFTIEDSTIRYGIFIQNVVDFTIIAFAIFLAVKIMNSVRKKEEEVPPLPSEEIVLLREIRDALRK